MQAIVWMIGLLCVVTMLAVLARRVTIPYPTLMVVCGSAISLIPYEHLPQVRVPPDIMLLLFLPPLLYAAAWNMPWLDFYANLRPISLLALGLVLATTVVVAVTAHAIIPGLPWAAAFVLGALVSPPDAVAATAITKTVHIPRRIVTILEGESLVNDATGLVAYNVAVAAVVTGSFSWSYTLSYFVLSGCGGVLVGLLVAWWMSWLHRRLDDPLIETVMTLLTPFLAYIPAESLHLSGVLATVTAGLYMRRQAAVLFSSQMRLQATAVWNVLVFLLNGVAFMLIGLQLREILIGIVDDWAWRVGLWAVAILAVTILVRLLYVYPAAWLPRLLLPELANRDPIPPFSSLTVIGWTGMRGVVTLAASLSLPMTTSSGSPFPYRELIIFIAFSVVLGTLVLQSLSLRWVIKRLGVSVPRSPLEADADARIALAAAAVRYIEQRSGADEDDIEQVGHLRRHFEVQAARALSRLAEEHPEFHEPLMRCRNLYAGAITAQRRTLEQLRASGEYDDDVLQQLDHDLDMEEARLLQVHGDGVRKPRRSATGSFLFEGPTNSPSGSSSPH